MRYCLNYNKTLKKEIFSKINELIITYQENDMELLGFCQKYKDKRIIVDVQDFDIFKQSNGINKIKGIKEAIPELNITLRIPCLKENFDLCKENNISFFCNRFANNWEVFRGLINEGVSDIYITEELCFSIKQCAEIAHSKNIYIRVFPDIAQSSWFYEKSITKFFIRPDDLIQYEPYVDILEFIGHSENQSAICEIYQSQKWAGPLKEIITDFNLDIDNRTIVPRFAQNRLSCQKRCLKGSSCNICETILKLSETLKNKNIVVRNKKLEKESIVEKEK